MQSGKPPDISELRVYIKNNYKTRGEMYDSNKRYKSAIAAKWNVHTDQIFSMLKKAVSFRPIVDIRRFITENVCDLPDRPDITAMQQNIRDYKHQERLAERQEEKQAALQNIRDLYFKSERALNQVRIHQYLAVRAEQQKEESAVLKLEKEQRERAELPDELTAHYEQLDGEAEDLNKRVEQLISDKASSDVSQEQDRLEQQRISLRTERERLLAELKNTAQDIKPEVFRRLGFCDKLSAGENDADFAFDLSDVTFCEFVT